MFYFDTHFNQQFSLSRSTAYRDTLSIFHSFINTLFPHIFVCFRNTSWNVYKQRVTSIVSFTQLRPFSPVFQMLKYLSRHYYHEIFTRLDDRGTNKTIQFTTKQSKKWDGKL